MPSRPNRGGRAQKVKKKTVPGESSTAASAGPEEVEPEPNPQNEEEVRAAIIIQANIRRFLAQRQLAALRKRKESYEAKVEEMSKDAYLKMVEAFRLEQDKKRAKEDAEDERVRAFNRRRKRMLECAYDGKTAEMEHLLQQVVEDDDKNGIGHDDIGRGRRLRHMQQLIECEDANKNTCLSEACIGGSVQAVQFLIDQGANVNSRGQFGRTPLYRAVFGGHADVVQVTTEGAIQELLSSWDTNETEKLLRQISICRKRQEDQLDRGAKAEMDKLKSQVDKHDKIHQSAQKKVCKMVEELNKRIFEYDTAKANGYENMAMLEQIIHDAELSAESAKVELDRARKQLQDSRLEMREQERKDKRKNSTDTRPGIVCTLRDLDDILFKDVGNRLLDSGNLRVGLLGALRYGKPFVLDLMEVDSTFETVCRERMDAVKVNLMEDIIEQRIKEDFIYQALIKPSDGDEFSAPMFMKRNLDKFLFIVLTKNPFPEQQLTEMFIPVWVDQ